MSGKAFKYYEDDYELAVLEYLAEEWEYTCGYDIHREKSEIVLIADLREYLARKYGSFTEGELQTLIGYITGFSNQSLYRAMKGTYQRLLRGYTLHREDGSDLFIEFFDTGEAAEEINVFRAVNQYEFEEYHLRRPDIVLFINGIPVSVFELKNPADEEADIKQAYDQTHNLYAREIPSLMKFDLINVISDGANTKYGALFSGYEFYFKWNSTNGTDYENADQIAGIKTLIKGLLSKRTLLTVLTNYIYFPDTSSSDTMILPKYYQYYGAEAMHKHIVEEYNRGGGKGGTFWGSTGCGKSYIMLYLARRLTTDTRLHKPTIVMLTDRTDLDDQLSGDFENAKEFLIDQNALCIRNRKMLHDYLDGIESGGIFLMTIQKFREDIDLLSDRRNIICISDEAHRTQTNVEAKYVTKGPETKKTYGFAKYIRDSFPNAIYVGFTGTPVEPTLRVFGDVVVKYTMRQSLEDGSTVKISRLPGPREVQLDEQMAKKIDEFYELQQSEGANEEQIEQSKRDMSRLEKVLGAPDRLDIVVSHFIQHYEHRCAEHSTVSGKAMFICHTRQIAYEVYERIKKARPEWLVKRRIAPEYDTEEPDRDALDIEKVKIICTPDAKRDPPAFLELVGDDKDRRAWATEFKNQKSNFKIAILVDMWITGFDVPFLDTMYLDKPIETHNLIQTISRVNRVFKGKEQGLIVDYIGLEGAILTAMKLYDGDISPVNGIDVSLAIFKDFMEKINELLYELDYSAFFKADITPGQRLNVIQTGVEFVLKTKQRTDNFMAYVKRAKKAFDICIGHDQITEREVEQLHYYLCVRSVIYKMTIGDTPDAELMNRKVADLVNRAISSTYSGEEFNFDAQTDDVQTLFSDEFLEKLKKIPYPNTKYQALIKLLKRAIKEFGRTNILKSSEFSKRLKSVIDKYNERNVINEVQEIIDDVVDTLSGELEQIYRDLKIEKDSFEKKGITYDEKAFYDILVAIADKYGFRNTLPDATYIKIAKAIKVMVGNKSKYTDWTNRQDVKDELYADIAVLLRRNGYPPKPIDEAYDEIMRQVDNFKKFN